jgi:thiol-disulfide isomerase/thioredoxin
MPPQETKPVAAGETLPIEGRFKTLDGATLWLNSQPLTREALKGKVVLVDFWTYSCINCLRALPYIRAWHEKYKDKGLVVIGVHAPEFAFEKDPANVRKAVADMHIAYPVALDNDFKIWEAFDNKYWPAHYFIDADGNIRHHHFGEGKYEESEAVIQRLLAEAGAKGIDRSYVQDDGSGAEMASDKDSVISPETYVGYGRGERFSSPESVGDGPQQFTAPETLNLNHWALAGNWTIQQERSGLNAPGGRIAYRFHARDLHLVLGPGPDGKPVKFRVRIDGQPPGADHGMDIDAAGVGTVTGERLYQLVRQSGDIRDRTFEIEFLDAGVQAYAFTFG